MLSSIAKYVHALGGQLKLTAVVGGDRIHAPRRRPQTHTAAPTAPVEVTREEDRWAGAGASSGHGPRAVAWD